MHTRPRAVARRGLVVAAAATGLTALLLTVTPGAALAAPQADTAYSFRSAAGDYIGGGQTKSYAAPAATITASGTAEGVSVSVNAGSDWWTVNLAAPRGEVLRPGSFHNAERASFRTGRAPGLDVYGLGRGCNEVYGEFTVDQIQTDGSGAVTVLDATFTQRCESAGAPPLVGTVHYNAYPLSYSYSSDAGDYIGGGRSKSYTNATTVFSVSGDTANGVHVGVSGLRDSWTIELAPATGEKLGVGTYPGAERAAFRSPGHPGLDAGGNGRGCNTVAGSFVIKELVTDANGTVVALSATFEQHCEGGVPVMRGTIHFNA